MLVHPPEPKGKSSNRCLRPTNCPKPKHSLFTIVNDRQQILTLANTWHVLLEKSLKQSIIEIAADSFSIDRLLITHQSAAALTATQMRWQSVRCISLKCDHTTMTSN